MNERKKNGQFGRNTIKWTIIKDLAYCYCNGEMLFFTNAINVPMFKDKPIAKMAAGYAATTGEDGKICLAHRLIIGAKDGGVVDHINRNKKDNRIENLRITDKSVNAFNTGVRKNNKSGYTGVRFRRDTYKWTAEIEKNGVTHYLGCFKTKEEAIAARAKAEWLYYGEN